MLGPILMKRSGLLTALIACVATAALGLTASAQAMTIAGHPLSQASADPGPTRPVNIAVESTTSGPPIRAGFVGVTTEFWDMFKDVGTDPTKPDVPYEQVLEALAPQGGLSFRIGGDTSDWTWWPLPGVATPPWARWTLTPTWMAVAQKLLTDIHAHLIFGLNMEANNPAVDTAEVQAVQSGIGPNVPTTYELGNEPELYPKWPYYITKAGLVVFGRPRSYSFPQITSEWDNLADQLSTGQLGSLRLAGIGYSSFRALPNVEQFLLDSSELSLLTMHTYALTPRNCQKGGDLQESSLFTPGSLQGLADDVGDWTELGNANGVPVRVDEINAVTCGGLINFSDTMGPALWALNVLPLYAETGVTGVNFESRVNTAQNLIQPTLTPTGWQVTVQPEYYGMLTFAQLTPPGSQILAISNTPSGVLAWAVQTPQHKINIVVSDVSSTPVRVFLRVAGARGPATTKELLGDTGDLSGTTATLGGQSVSPTTGQLTGTPVSAQVKSHKRAYSVRVAPASATVLTVAG